MRNRLFVLCLFLLLALLLLSKDKIFLYVIDKKFEKLLPQNRLTIATASVGLGSLELTNFFVEKKDKKSFEALEIEGGHFSCRYSVFDLLLEPLLSLNEVKLFLRTLRYGASGLDDFDFICRRNKNEPKLDATFSFKTLSTQGEEAADFKGRLTITPKALVLEEARGSMLGGKASITGRLGYEANKQISTLILDLDSIALKDLLTLFGARRGLDVNGTFSGTIVLKIKAGQLDSLTGRLDSVGGGKFIMLEPSALADKNFKAAKEANIVIENLKNYHYDIGKIEIRNYGQDIRMDIFLEGLTGKRHLEVFWHNNEGK